MHDNDHCTGIAAKDNARFVLAMTLIFTAVERSAWGSTFAHAERAGWIAPRNSVSMAR